MPCLLVYLTALDIVTVHVKPGNKNQMLGTLDDFEFVVDYASIISLA